LLPASNRSIDALPHHDPRPIAADAVALLGDLLKRRDEPRVADPD
jgi:hypothetical protein